ncbi:MAG TPA: heparan-alpha-glucosaminide N-acetyltransferase domain-containing protein [Candidatus Krumholzibacteria bacterium]|nr:heparan-alpha-glucosaminide N-acetyltransferase domain-containing protein [Candidatus Krumholzibacteria bacterium]
MTAPPPTTRLASVDALRGLTMAAMIVVNNPGSWSAMHPWLRHAPWGGWPRPADLIFPTFLFLVGVSTALALGRRLDAGASRADVTRAALRRAGGLVLLGVLLNLYPEFDAGTVRLPGVLQRIAVVFAGCALAYPRLGPHGLTATAAALIAGYGALLAWAPVPGAGGPVLTPDASLPTWLDDRLLGAHAWRGPGDPEGLLSTLPALAHGLLGVWVGRKLRRGGPPLAGAVRMAAVGAGLVLGGIGWTAWQPPAKEIWTPSYALLTAGASLLLLAACRAGFDGVAGGRAPSLLTLLGRRALTAFVAAHLISDTAIRVLRWTTADGGETSLHHWLKAWLWDGWLPPQAASLAASLALLGLITAGLWLWEQRRADITRA